MGRSIRGSKVKGVSQLARGGIGDEGCGVAGAGKPDIEGATGQGQDNEPRADVGGIAAIFIGALGQKRGTPAGHLGPGHCNKLRAVVWLCCISKCHLNLPLERECASFP